MSFRPATFADAKTINAIRNHYIQNTTATLEYHTWSDEDFLQLMYKRDEKTPIYAVEKDGKLVGYGVISYFGDKPGYRVTAELGLYLSAEAQGSGLGKQLLAFLLQESKRLGFHSALSRITAENAISIALHEKAGFSRVAVLKEIGRKFDRFVDAYFYQKLFTDATDVLETSNESKK